MEFGHGRMVVVERPAGIFGLLPLHRARVLNDAGQNNKKSRDHTENSGSVKDHLLCDAKGTQFIGNHPKRTVCTKNLLSRAFRV